MSDPHVIKKAALNLSVDNQFELAKSLAANCGYDLIAQDVDTKIYDDRISKIKELIGQFKTPFATHVFNGCNDPYVELIIEGLEGLLK